MATETATNFLQAIPVVIGGAIALVGALVAQWVTHHVAMEREREKLLIDKGEKLVTALYAHRGYVDELIANYASKNQLSNGRDPLPEVQTLQELYFPSLIQESDLFNDAVEHMISHMVEESIKRSAKNAKWKCFDEAALVKFHDTYRSASSGLIQAVSRKMKVKVQG